MTFLSSVTSTVVILRYSGTLMLNNVQPGSRGIVTGWISCKSRAQVISSKWFFSEVLVLTWQPPHRSSHHQN